MDPLILTLRLGEDSFARLDALRRRHFPPGRNLVPAHVTLFQQLPGEALGEIVSRLAPFAARTQALDFTTDAIVPFSNGAAIGLSMPGFDALHAALRRTLSDLLSASDDRRRKPHVTVQNKTTRTEAQATQALLRDTLEPWSGVADGLLLWHYRGGPWEAARDFALQGETR